MSERNAATLRDKAIANFDPKQAAQLFADINGDTSFDVNVLSKYENLLENGMKARKRIASQLNLNDRIELWKTQLAYHLATSSLTKSQSDYILDIISKMPAIFEASKTLTGAEKEKYLESLENSMFAVFGKPGAYAIFMEIGIQKIVRDLPISASLIKRNSSAPFMKITYSSYDNVKPISELAGMQLTCDCRWYCSSGSCQGSSCFQVENCGPFGTWKCTSMCVTRGGIEP